MLIAMVQLSKLYDDPFLRNTFLAKTSLSFVFRGTNSVHPEVFRHANHNSQVSKLYDDSFLRKHILG